MKKLKDITKEDILKAIEAYYNMQEEELKQYGGDAKRHYLEFDNKYYPVKQSIRIALGYTTKELNRIMKFTSKDARKLLEKLGFAIKTID